MFSRLISIRWLDNLDHMALARGKWKWSRGEVWVIRRRRKKLVPNETCQRWWQKKMRSRWIFLSSLFDVSLLWSEIYLILWGILLWEFHNFHPKLPHKIFVSFILEQSLCWLPIFLRILQFVRLGLGAVWRSYICLF